MMLVLFRCTPLSQRTLWRSLSRAGRVASVLGVQAGYIAPCGLPVHDGCPQAGIHSSWRSPLCLTSSGGPEKPQRDRFYFWVSRLLTANWWTRLFFFVWFSLTMFGRSQPLATALVVKLLLPVINVEAKCCGCAISSVSLASFSLQVIMRSPLLIATSSLDASVPFLCGVTLLRNFHRKRCTGFGAPRQFPSLWECPNFSEPKPLWRHTSEAGRVEPVTGLVSEILSTLSPPSLTLPSRQTPIVTSQNCNHAFPVPSSAGSMMWASWAETCLRLSAPCLTSEYLVVFPFTPSILVLTTCRVGGLCSGQVLLVSPQSWLATAHPTLRKSFSSIR